ncbi:patatin-like phospholipase family protein [Novilysobacter antarcticus]|uniref:patatin-like phospholipase family protein n=1 Tax=Novilysobacter antarcticus TaxID=2862543 RepID=UPI001C9954D9|nr:patatin-like phospholipase family protein [Lysobacter antarcticus]
MKARRVLSIDGGGIRGLVTCTWLQGVADALAEAGRPGLQKSFDLVAGSSTGAVIACGLGMGLAPAQMAGLYRERGQVIFPGMANRLWSRAGRLFRDGPSAPKYDGKGLESVLREVFGKLTLGELQMPVVITSYDTLSRQPVIFKSFKAEHQDLLVWEVCRASTAAPTYFPAHPLVVEGQPCSLIDGGVVANNPTACAIAEAIRHDAQVQHCQQLTVLSVGSGQRNRPISLRQAREWGALEWAIPIIDVLFDGNTDSVDYIARQIVGQGYHRMQAELRVGLDDLDDVSATNLAALDAMASAYLAEPATGKMLRTLISHL